jgi:tRNA(Arg) A34 adenosine deaminase TadA
MTDVTHPPRPSSGRLNDLWDAPARDLASLAAPALEDGELERHRVYSLLLMALVARYWNGNKRGREGSYPWRDGQKRADGQYEGGDYLGHNIACLAVDATGAIIDFDFNHNEVFNSSVEHAESRLVRRVFSLAQIYDGWAMRAPVDPPPPLTYATQLSEVTVYTSLESCSQCSGIMALGSVRRVVFLQRDPGQSSIGNILRNLSPPGASFAPPLPLPADLLGVEHFTRLGDAYDAFTRAVSARPFFVAKDGTLDTTPSITSFLCTDEARAIFDAGRAEFNLYAPRFDAYTPLDDHGDAVPGALTNTSVLAQARSFYQYADRNGDRGTSHRV